MRTHMRTITSTEPTQPLDVLGAVVELLTDPALPEAAYCVIKGTIPAGMVVPLHSHPDEESFFVVSGTAEVLKEIDGRLEWSSVEPGDFVHIPGGVRHAHRNRSARPVVELAITTSQLGRFFREVGRSIGQADAPRAPTPDEVARFTTTAARYGHWMASPSENASVGIELPPPPA
jgi:quercetin dioxygenase-like cupin family protein